MFSRAFSLLFLASVCCWASARASPAWSSADPGSSRPDQAEDDYYPQEFGDCSKSELLNRMPFLDHLDGDPKYKDWVTGNTKLSPNLVGIENFHPISSV